MVSASSVQSGNLHRYSKHLVAFEYDRPSSAKKHLLIWVGGLGDGLMTVSYPSILAQKLPSGWSLAQAMLSSSYNGWGTSTLQRDVKELGQCVDYFRKILPSDSKIVIMGHSTGCQDAMEYLSGQGNTDRPVIDGAILQAPVSDREVLNQDISKEALEAITKKAQEWSESGRGDDIIPLSEAPTTFGRTPVTAYRWLSLLSPNKDGDDDYFSSDLTDDQLRKTFGAIKSQTLMLILHSGSDQYVPSFVDKAAVVKRWTGFIKDGGGAVDEEHGGVLPNAHHSLEESEVSVIQELSRRVSGFLRNVEHGQTQNHSQL